VSENGCVIDAQKKKARPRGGYLESLKNRVFALDKAALGGLSELGHGWKKVCSFQHKQRGKGKSAIVRE